MPAIPDYRRYEVRSEIKRSPHLRLFLARDLELNRTVVLKTLNTDHSSNTERGKIEREFALLRDLRHPGIVQVLDYGINPSLGPFLTLRSVGASSLHQLVGRLNYQQLIDALTQLSLALEYLTSRGIVHRDISPDNIGVEGQPDSASLSFLLLNFESASKLPAASSPPAPHPTCPSFSPPEVIDGLAADHRSDIYSLGLTLLEATGSTNACLPRTDNGRLDQARLANVLASLPQPLASLISWMTTHAPAGRPTFAGEITQLCPSVSSDRASADSRAYYMHVPLVARSTILRGVLGSVEHYSHSETRNTSAPPRMFLFAGERGVGKSRLVREIRLEAQLRGYFHVPLCSTPTDCDPFSSLRCYLSILDASVADSFDPRPPNQLSLDLDTTHPSAYESKRLGHDSNKLESLHALAFHLINVSRSHPVCITVDDLHEADNEVLEFLRFLSVHSDGPLVIGTYTADAELPTPLRAMLASTTVSDAVHSAALERLSLEHTSEYLAAAFGTFRGIEALNTKVHVLANGNPFLIQEALTGLLVERALTRLPTGWHIDHTRLEATLVPANLLDLVERKVTALDSRLRSQLATIAVFGVPVLPLELHALTSRDLGGIARDLAFLESAGILSRHESDHGTAYGFRDGYLRDTVYRGLDPNESRRIHSAIGTLVEVASATSTISRTETLAHHFVQARDRDKGPIYAFRAARNALERCSVSKAIRWLTMGTDLLHRDDTGQRFYGLEMLGQLLVMTGDLAHAERVYEEMLLLSRTTAQLEKEATAILALARLYIEAGDMERGLQYADDARHRFEMLSAKRGQASAVLTRASALHKSGDLQAAMQAIELGRQLAEGSQDYYESSLARILEGLVYCSLGEYPDALSCLFSALAIKRRINDIEGMAVALGNIGFVLLEQKELTHARTYLDEALELARRRGIALAGILAALNLGEVELLLGNLDAGAAHFHEAAALANSSGRRYFAAYAWYSLSCTNTQRGLFSGAIAQAKACESMNREAGSRRELGLVLISLSEINEFLGRRTEAIVYAAESQAIAESIGNNSLIVAARLQMGSILLTESPFKARTLLRDSEVHAAREAGRKDNLSKLLAGRASIRLAEGDAPGALDDVREHKELARGAGLRPDVAKAALIEGQALLKLQQPVEARLQLGQAVVDAREMGLRPLLSQLLYWLSQAQEASQQEVQAAHSIFEAADLVREIAAAIKEPELRESYLASAPNLAVLQRCERLERAGFRRPELSAESGLSPAESGADIFAEAARRVDASSGLRDLLTAALDRTIEAIRADRGLLVLLDRDPENPEISIARNLEGETIQDATDYCRSIVQEVGAGRSLLVEDAPRDEQFRQRRSVTLHHILSLMCVPLRSGERVLGALYFDSRSGDRLFRESHLKVVEGVAERAARAIEEARENQLLRERAIVMNRELARHYHIDSLVGESAAMQRVFRMMESIIRADCNVLLTGESGTGKELVARAVHFAGARKLCNFVPLDCGAVPDTLVESELFGYRKGAFSGADSDKKGLLEEADGGTLFLDEIANSTATFQAKLLRALQSGEFRRLGDTLARRTDARIIAATNANIDHALKEGRFREDLYYRLNVVTLNLPPLRERKEDIALLADHFARAFCTGRGIAYQGLGEGALARLRAHIWPGNVRELQHAIEAALIVSNDGMVHRESLPERILGGRSDELRDLLTSRPHAAVAQAAAAAAAAPPDLSRQAAPLDERAMVEQALAQAGGDKSRAARLLGWNRMRLYRSLKRFGIDYATGQGHS